MFIPSWPNVQLVADEDYVALDFAVDAIEAALRPQVPPEVWNEAPVDGDRAMAAVRAMCGGQR